MIGLDDDLEQQAEICRVERENAERIAQAIEFNVDEFYLDLITADRFAKRQVRLWNRAERAGVAERVTVLVRPKLNAIRSIPR